MTAKQIYFMQHALAAGKDVHPERPITQQGTQQTQDIARRLCLLESSFSFIFHSGKLRAQQTAEIVAAILGVDDIHIADHLSPNDDTAGIRNELNQEGALYVGHLPHLEKLVSALVTGNEAPGIIRFQNSAIVCLQSTGVLYQIQWYLTPQLV